MKLLLKYKSQIVSLGLLPTIVTLTGLHFLPHTTMLGIGLTASLIGLCYDIFRLKSLNFFLLQGTIGIGTCFLLRLMTGYEYIPPRSITPTLEFLLLIFAFVYATAPEIYQSFLKRFRLNANISCMLEAKVIVILSSLHLLGLFLFQNRLDTYDNRLHFFLVFYIPTMIYTLCLIINMAGIHLAASQESLCSIIRIAPVCNGKIYLIPYKKDDSSEHIWDIPLVFIFEKPPHKSKSFATTQARKFLREISGNDMSPFISPRLILKYKIEKLTPHPVQLFIFPIDREEKCRNGSGRFFTFSELEKSSGNFSRTLLVEKEHLQISANLWKEFTYK